MKSAADLQAAVEQARTLAQTLDRIAKENSGSSWRNIHETALSLVNELQKRMDDVEQSITNNMGM